MVVIARGETDPLGIAGRDSCAPDVVLPRTSSFTGFTECVRQASFKTHLMPPGPYKVNKYQAQYSEIVSLCENRGSPRQRGSTEVEPIATWDRFFTPPFLFC